MARYRSAWGQNAGHVITGQLRCNFVDRDDSIGCSSPSVLCFTTIVVSSDTRVFL